MSGMGRGRKLNDAVEGGDGSQEVRGRSVVLADGRRLTIRLEPAVWDALDELCRRERVALGLLVEAGCAVFSQDAPADILYRTALGYWMKAAIVAGLDVSADAAGGIGGSDAVLAEARRQMRGRTEFRCGPGPGSDRGRA